MNWLHPSRKEPHGDPEPEGPEGQPEGPAQRAAPGVEALFSGLKEDGSQVILDLGPASPAHLRIFGRFARQIRFAGLLPTPPHGAKWTEALRGLPPHQGQPYDVVLAWNLLDRLYPPERAPLIERLDQVTAPGAGLYIVVTASDEPTTRPFRFTLLDLDRVSQEPVGPPQAARHRLLPAEVERLLAPFEVTRAFTLRSGLREYVAVKTSETTD